MRKFATYAAAQVGAALLAYGLFAFVLWDAYPGDWPSGTRLLTVLIWAGAAWIAGILTAAATGDIL